MHITQQSCFTLTCPVKPPFKCITLYMHITQKSCSTVTYPLPPHLNVSYYTFISPEILLYCNLTLTPSPLVYHTVYAYHSKILLYCKVYHTTHSYSQKVRLYCNLPFTPSPYVFHTIHAIEEKNVKLNIEVNKLN